MIQSQGPSHADLNASANERIGLGMVQRPTKSAANKYRNIIGNAIQEEVYHDASDYIRKGGRLRNNLLVEDEDDDSIQDGGCTAPIAMRIHKSGRRSHVRLKHRDEEDLRNKNAHTVSQGAGVLVANYGGDSRLDDTDGFTKLSGNMKSVYDIRMSYTRPSSMPKGKRSMLKSAVTRVVAPRLTTEGEQALSHQNMRPPVGPNTGLSQSRPMINTRQLGDASRNEMDSRLRLNQESGYLP